jgi:arabinofuranan 3-O-arabinosyltransferase
MKSCRTGADADRGFPRLLGIFAAWRLQAYGYALAALYAVLLVGLYKTGFWIVDSRGVPVYSDFICPWLAGVQALHGGTVLLYDPAEFAKIQEALVGPKDYFYPNWPYPPTFFFVLIPFAMLPYVYAFIVWDAVTLTSCIAVVYLIGRRLPAISLVLASPLTAWILCAGQNGLLWASLLGASLLFLERQPALAGVLIGCLTWKPQFGILLPVALAASNQRRAFASAAATAVLLASASVVAFGTAVWEAFPRELAAQTGEVLVAGGHAHPTPDWGYIQTIYGLVRALHGGAAVAWLAQGATAVGVAIIVWLVWRSPVRYSLKAATLSAAALIATPYAFATDLAAIVIPVAFLASDQIRCGLLRGEQTVMIALFGASFVILVTFGSTPLGPVVMITLLCVILRRAVERRQLSAQTEQETPALATSS